MTIWLHSEDLTELARRRVDVFLTIERLLTRRDIVGEWTPSHRAEYDELCRQEQELFRQMREATAKLLQ
jgi:hypothetical protein